jgi:periplasmic protein TonB
LLATGHRSQLKCFRIFLGFVVPAINPLGFPAVSILQDTGGIAMFEHSLMESANVAPSHRALTTSLTALAQLTLLAIAILLPMVFTQTLPLLKPHAVDQIMIPRSVPPPELAPSSESSSQSALSSRVPTIVVNKLFPARPSLAAEHAVADPQIPQAYGTGNTSARDLPLGNSLSTSNLSGPGPPLRVSRLNEGSIIRRVKPAYPALAKLAGIQGDVLIEAMISRNGTIENLRVLSGHPTLAASAKEAVAQWQFRPYILNGKPIEVVTQITVEFKLRAD